MGLNLAQGLELGAVIDHLLTLPSLESRLAYLEHYITNLKIVRNRLDQFMTTGDFYWLLGEPFMIKIFLDEGFEIDLSDDPENYNENFCEAYQIAEALRIMLMSLVTELRLKKKEFQRYSELNYDPLSQKRDTRIKFNGTQKKLKDIFREFEKEGFTAKDSWKMNMAHFRCTDSSDEPDWQQLANHVIQIRKSDNKFSIVWEAFADLGYIDKNNEIKYTQLTGHFINRRSSPFADLCRKYGQLDTASRTYIKVTQMLKRIQSSDEEEGRNA